MMFKAEELADKIFEGRHAESQFEEKMFDLRTSDEFDYSNTTHDWYDCSWEYKGANNEARLNAAQQEFLFAAGFMRCWICHKDGSETYYYKTTGHDQFPEGTILEHRKSTKT